MAISEAKFQSTCFINHWNYYPEHRLRLCCINNNSYNAFKGSMDKSMGVVAGVSDMFYLLEDGKIRWLEFKIEGGKQSQKQIEWEQKCKSLGHDYRLIFTEDEFWKAVNLPKPIIK